MQRSRSLDRETAVQLTVRGQKCGDPSLWHVEGGQVALECARCGFLPRCEELSTRAPIFGCSSLCCGRPDVCTLACSRRPLRLHTLIRDVDGIEVRPYTGAICKVGSLPHYIPKLADRGGIVSTLPIRAVAVSLYDIVDMRSGLAVFESREAFLNHFKLPQAVKLVIDGAGTDEEVERFWSVLRPRETATSLRELVPALVTTPDFSVILNRPRPNDFVSLARILRCFEEMAVGGLPVSLHVHGRNVADYRYLADFIRRSPGVGVISASFATMAWSQVRRKWHARVLADFPEMVGRALRVTVRGGVRFIPHLAARFEQVIQLDSTAHLKAKHWRQASELRGVLTWSQIDRDSTSSIQDIFVQNALVLESQHAALRGPRTLLPRESQT